MELDKSTIKVLAADTRIDILKSLQKRRKMPTELAKELNLAPSTIAEHLKNLESVGLIHKKDTGHKWIYYELTGKGSNIVQPRYPVNILLTLGIGLIFITAGFSYYFTIPQTTFVATGIEPVAGQKQVSEVQPVAIKPEVSEKTSQDVQTIPQGSLQEATKIEQVKIQRTDIPLASIVIIIIGVLLLVFGSWRLHYSRKNLKFETISL